MYICSSDIPELQDIIIPEPMKLIKAMRTIIRYRDQMVLTSLKLIPQA